MKLKTAKRSNKWKKVLIWSCLSVIIVVIGLFVYLQSVTYSPSERAEAAMNPDSQVSINKIKNGYRFEPEGTEIVEPNIIFIREV